MTPSPSSTPLSRGAAWVVAWRLVGIATTVIGNIAVARLLGPARFGVFLLVTTVIALGSVLAMGGLNEAGLRFISASLGLGQPRLARAYLQRVLVWTLPTALGAAAVTAAGLFIFQAARGELEQPALIVALAAIGVVALAWQQIAAESLRGYGDLRLASLFSGGQSGGPAPNLLFLFALAIGAFVCSPLTLSLTLALLVGSICLTAPLAFAALLRESRSQAALGEVAAPAELSFDRRRELRAAAGSLLVIQLLTFATYQLDIWIGGAILSPADLGLFGVAKRCQLIAQIPVQMAMMTVISLVPRLHAQGRMAELEHIVRRAATLAAVPSVAALALLALFPNAIVELIVGDAYRGAAPVLLPLVAGQLMHVLLGNPAYVLTMTGHHPLVLRINVIAAFIMVVAGAWGALVAGPTGLAWASAAAITVQNGLLWWTARQRLGVRTHVGSPLAALRDWLLAPPPNESLPNESLPIAAIPLLAASALPLTNTAPNEALPIAAIPAAVASLDSDSLAPPPLAPVETPLGAPFAAASLAAPFAVVAAASIAAPHDALSPPAHSHNSPSSLRRLWWLHPAWPFGLVVSSTIVAAYWQGARAYQLYGTPKYVELEHVLMAFAAIAAFVVGCSLAQATGKTLAPASSSTDNLIRKCFYALVGLTIFGYAAWFAVGFKNGFTPRMFLALLTGEGDYYDSIRRDLFPTIPGVTTCTQFGVAAVLLGAWLFVRGERKRVLWPLAALFAVATIRCVLFSERTAIIELLLPMMIVGLRAYVLGRPMPPLFRKALFVAPVLGAVAMLLMFGFFEYYRSWKFYQNKFDSYPEFTVWRLSGYFTTAHNNGAMALATHQPRPLPYYTLRPLWEFPGIRATPFAYHRLTGIDMVAAHEGMLQRYGTIELNNEGGLFQPALDYGWAGFLVYWCLYGFIASRLYRAFLAGTFAGVVIYPLVYMSLLEVPLILFLFYTRTFPPLAALVAVAWLASRAAPSAERLPPKIESLQVEWSA